MSTPAVHINELTKNYNGTQALNGVNLTIPKGSFFGLLGPNGAGKTTTINILTGLVRKTSGKSEIFGFDTVKEFRQSRLRIGLSPQELNFDHFFTIRDMLALQGGYYGMSFKDGLEKADILLGQFGLEEKRNAKARDLSGGMKRRLQIAKALIHDPPLIILDEPTAGVDIELRHMLWDFLKQQNSNGKTILLTTHYIEEAENLCDSVAIIDQGKIITEGSPNALIQTSGTSVLEIKVNNWMPTDFENKPSFTVTDNTLHIPTKSPEKEMIWWIKELTDKQMTVENIHINRSSLEDVFLKLTGRSILD